MATVIKHKDICIRGQVFPTIRAAAEHHGVTYHAVKWALLKGKLDRVGLGLGRPAIPMRVRIRDMTFDTAADAARHMGLQPNTIRTAIWRGSSDRLGLARPYRGPAKPCTIYGLTWPSRAAACRDLGLSHGFLWHVEHAGGRRSRETLLGRVQAYLARQEFEAALDPADPAARALIAGARQREVARRTAAGERGCDIAAAMKISVGAVARHQKALKAFEKTQADAGQPARAGAEWTRKRAA